jgi:hypothetical protein
MMKKTKHNAELATRRKWPRYAPEGLPSLKGITLNQGNQAHVVDISCGGALIETDLRLCPQAKVGFKVLTTDGAFRITGSVLRSSIKALKRTPIYRCAITFNNPLTMLDYLDPAKAELAGLASAGGG